MRESLKLLPMALDVLTRLRMARATPEQIDDVQNLSRNFLRGWWPHGSGRLVVFEAIEPTEEEATNERG